MVVPDFTFLSFPDPVAIVTVLAYFAVITGIIVLSTHYVQKQVVETINQSIQKKVEDVNFNEVKKIRETLERDLHVDLSTKTCSEKISEDRSIGEFGR